MALSVDGRLSSGGLRRLSRAAGQTSFQTRSIFQTPKVNSKHISLLLLLKIALVLAVMDLCLMTVLALPHIFGSLVSLYLFYYKQYIFYILLAPKLLHF